MTQIAPPTYASYEEEVTLTQREADRTQDRTVTVIMARCNPQCFLNQRLSLQLLALVLTMTWHVSVTANAAKIQLSGEVGGNVTFHCPVDEPSTIEFFYLQKGKTFVNGFHATRIIEAYQKNTRLENKTSVYMHSLTVSDGGDYRCIMNSGSIKETEIHLSVTAKYSKPAVTVSCNHESCKVECTSHGGYPGTKMMWNVNGSQIWNVVNSSEMPDSVTMLFNSSSTASFNCSNGELKNLSCFVGDVTSELFSVCKPKDPPIPSDPYVIATAICAVVLFSIMVMVVLWWRCKKRVSRSSSDGRLEISVNGHEEKVIFLNEKKGGEEAS